MARRKGNVKSDRERRWTERYVDGFFAYIETHPRTGWYIALLATLNFFLNLIDAFDLF